MGEGNAYLKNLPRVDDIILKIASEAGTLSETIVKRTVQEQIEKNRRRIQSGECTSVMQEQIIADVTAALEHEKRRHLHGVINATGVILHTNLGRSRLSPTAVAAVTKVAGGYSNLEYELETGERGHRCDYAESLLIQLTGAEAAVIVNNNAAALLLILDSLSKGKQVIISRGELVEIGGSFRLPDVIKSCGCELVEVGTTNKTKLSDYAERVTERTGVILKVHTSNYKIVGFTQDVAADELNGLDVPVIYDMGGGLLVPLDEYGIRGEPTVAQCVPHADVLCFSGDKLLGGAQAGIIVGRSKLVDIIRSNALLRALRIDKLTLAALEKTLEQYLFPDALSKITTLRMITEPVETQKAKAERLINLLTDKSNASIIDTTAQTGGGTLPEAKLPSIGVSINCENFSANALEAALRGNCPPIIARITNDCVVLDMRTVDENELEAISECLNCLHEKSHLKFR